LAKVDGNTTSYEEDKKTFHCRWLKPTVWKMKTETTPDSHKLQIMIAQALTGLWM
jgi:hypothetical protein